MHKREDVIDYYNCGAWIDARPTYITIGEEGVQIHEYVERPDFHPAGEQNLADTEPAEFDDEAGFVEDGEYEGVAT
jgi:hypothetical protein